MVYYVQIRLKGDSMFMKRFMKKTMKGFVSLLLALTVIMSCSAPFDLSVLAEETAATGSDIHAIYYYIDPSKKTNGVIDVTANLELVFQRGGIENPSKTVFKHYTDFADVEKKPDGMRNPWYRDDYVNNKGTVYATEVMRVDIKDRIAPTNMAGWFWQMNRLNRDDFKHLENIDASLCTNMFYLFCGCKSLTNIDLTIWDVPNVANLGNTFNGCSVLTDVNLSTWQIPKANYIPGIFANCTSLERVDISSFRIDNPYTIGSMFDGCTKLKDVKLFPASPRSETQLAYIFRGCSSLEEVDLSMWNIQKPGTFREMFKGCTSLKRVDFGPAENWGTSTTYWSFNGWYNSSYERMFEDCTSLESLDLTCVKGALVSSSTFKGCTSLKEVNLSYAGKGRENRKNYPSGPADPDLSDRANIFEGCEELSWIKLSAEGWPAAGLAGTSIPPKSSWKKIDEPNKNLRRSSDELFLNFQTDYAGTWVTDSFITFKGNGGTPNFQTIDGAKDVALDYNENELTAARNGYDFLGWWTEEDGGTQVHPGDIAEQWSYYAHWNEHKYNLVLDGNGGTVPLSYSGSGTVSADRTTLTFNNLNYTQFLELTKQMFYKSDDFVLASWNTRKNGKGTEYIANDSVNKLAEAEGATAILYAQWHEPDAIIRFDSDGGSELNEREYAVGAEYGNIPESYKTGYTFTGWYTEPGGAGTKIESDSVVTGSRTLYAYWVKNPVVTFNANGGKIDGENTESKVYTYGAKIGRFPVPTKGSATLKGWYTAASGGAQVTENTIVSDGDEYFAQWGWAPKFETNGGTYTYYPTGGYITRDSPSYQITALPEAEKDHSTFAGWFFGNTEVHAGDIIDLSSNNVIKARWNDTVTHTVTLNFNNGETPNDTIAVYHGNPVGQLPTPTRSGYIFEGWFDANDAEYKYNTPDITSNVTLTAKWTEKDVTVTFDPCGGTMVDSNTIQVVGGKTIPTIPGVNYLNNKGEIQYRFGGWYTQPEGAGTPLDKNTVISADATYYAKWLSLRTQADNDYVHAIHWATISNTEVTNTGGHLVFHPTVHGDINARLYISLEKPDGGTLNLPDNTLSITIPAKFFDSSSEKNNLSAFFTESGSGGLKAKYSDDNQSIIFYNPNALTKNTIIMPEFSVSPTALKGGYIDEKGYYQGTYFQKTFEVKIDIAEFTVNNVTTPAQHYSRQMGLEVHTNPQTTVSKARADVSLNWDTDWGTTPVDAKEYFYVVWSLTATTTNCTQPYKLKWSEDTLHDGAVVYSDPSIDNDEWSPLYTSGGTHTTKVVTKHRRADVQNTSDSWATVKNEAILNVLWNDEHEQQFRASRTAEVFVPKEGSGSFTFAKNIPDYLDQNKHSINGGQELILNGEPELMNFPYEIGYLENRNTDNPTWNAEAGTYRTKPRTIAIEDGASGDVMLSTDYGAASRTWDSQYIKALNQSDYYFSTLEISLTEYDAVYMDGKWSEPYVNTDVSNYSPIKIYVKTVGSDRLELAATLTGVNCATVTLPANTTYFKVEHTTDCFTTRLDVNPTLYLTKSNHVFSLVSSDVEKKRDTIVMNKARIITTREGEAPIVTETSADAAWRSIYLLNISSSTLYASKVCGTAILDLDSAEECSVVIAGWNFNNSLRGYKKYIKSGVFHDLLPKDCTVDKSTVFVRPRETNTTKLTEQTSQNWANRYKFEILEETIPETYYSVSFVDNWEGSGRTMMIVTVNTPEGRKFTGYDVFYKMETTHSNINIYGINLINSVSFTDTTNGQSAPDNRSGTKNVLDSKSSPYYNSIDSPRTAFATDKTNYTQPVVFQYGAESTVKAVGSSYSSHEIVGLNTDYDYKVTYSGGDTSKTSELVFYDVIERYIGGSVSEWHGELKSIDISSIKTIESANGKGCCDPVVYYSAKNRDDFTEEDFDITNTAVWTTVKPADDLITAFAVDCTKTTSGDPFILDTKKSIGFNINMRSPSRERQSELETYNDAVIKGRIVDLNVPIESKALTSVTLRFANPRLEKTAFPESGEDQQHPENVVQGSVLEYAVKITNPDKELEMDDIVLEDVFSNTMKFTNTIKAQLGSGAIVPITQMARVSSYSVNEVGDKMVFTAAISSLAPGEAITIIIPVTVTDEIGTKITNKAKIKSINGVDYSIESNETYHEVSECKVKILKVNGHGNPLEGAVLQVLDENKEVVSLTNDNVNYCTQFTSTDKVIHFNLTPGTYYVHEVSAPEGFNTGSDIKFSIDDEGIITVGNEEVSHVTVTDTAKYRVIFHEAHPDGKPAEFSRSFRVYEPNELNNDKSISHFYDIPSFAGDNYVFMGWYHNADYSTTTKANVTANAITACDFEHDTYASRDSDYHIYARWIKVGYVNKDAEDDNQISGSRYRGFGLAGVQIREENMIDANYGDKITPAGMRFVTSISEDLLRQIDEISDKQVVTDGGLTENVEYGYVAAKKTDVDTFVNHYKAVPSEYSLQYKGENVNGVNTLGEDKNSRDVNSDYRYISNINCTSSHPINGKSNGQEYVKDDHRNYGAYRLYTLVITYEGDSASKKGESVDARAYIRYYDANGKLRVFYNNYNNTQYYGGCMCSYNQVVEMSKPKETAPGSAE